jgi:hypothetical protein
MDLAGTNNSSSSEQESAGDHDSERYACTTNSLTTVLNLMFSVYKITKYC